MDRHIKKISSAKKAQKEQSKTPFFILAQQSFIMEPEKKPDLIQLLSSMTVAKKGLSATQQTKRQQGSLFAVKRIDQMVVDTIIN